MTHLDEKQLLTAEWLVSESMKSEPNESSIINLAGAVGSGKTSVLRLTEGLFRKRGLEPIFLSVPIANSETSAILLAEIGDRLASFVSLNGETEILRDPKRRWIDKFQAVTRVIDKVRDRFVILCDEPSHWFRPSSSEIDDTSDQHARMVSDWLFKEARCRRVVSGRVVATGLPLLKRHQAPRIDDGRAVLEDAFFWGSKTADLANSVSAFTKKAIEDRAVMEIRLLVAWAWLFDTKSAAQRCIGEYSANSLLEDLLNGLENSAQTNDRHQALCQALARLAVSRVKLPQTVFASLLADLSPLEADVVRDCFCEKTPDTISLHPLVAHEIELRARDRKRKDLNQAWRLIPEERNRVHSRLYELANQSPAGHSFRADLEALHHGALSNNIDDLAKSDRLHFVEQLHEIGRSLSYVFREHRHAADIFRMALRLDEDNAYSHHYLAFNLDWEAVDADEVERHYQKAIELQPEHPWWWSRWISYLATRGRFKVAGKEWRNALDALSVSEDATPEWIYLSLHRWVARWMLHWSNLDFAENVLRSIPSSLQSDASISRLNDLLTAMRFAEQGNAVFPLSVPASEWWSPQPHTNLPNEIAGDRLTHWYPARVQHIDDCGNIFLLYAQPPINSQNDPILDEMGFSRDQLTKVMFEFDGQSLHEGSFVELGYYGLNQELKIAVHAEEPLNDPDLIPLVPPPDRWYQRAVEATWHEVGS